ncbi:hypothetical protein BD779DRAFT_1385310, partial [Infundibulicybe gibba]
EVYVAHYGHPRLLGAKHWAIIVATTPGGSHSIAYQVTGSTTTYTIKEPERIDVLYSQTYLGRVKVGYAHKGWHSETHNTSLEKILRNTPVVHGDLGWNCQNWVVAGLCRLREAGYDIMPFSHRGLRAALAVAV